MSNGNQSGGPRIDYIMRTAPSLARNTAGEAKPGAKPLPWGKILLGAAGVVALGGIVYVVMSD